MSLTGVLNSHLMMAHLIRMFGTDEQRARLPPEARAGRAARWARADRADCGHRPAGDPHDRAGATATTYVVNGTKTWITNGGHGNCLALLVKTDLDAEPRSRGMSVLLAPKDLDGYTVPRKLGKLGYKGVDTVELLFDDVAVDRAASLGGVEGRGIAQVLGGLELGRINVAARGVGVADAALQASLALREPARRRWDGRSGSTRRSS